MKLNDKLATIKRYNERLSQFGYDLKTLGWGGDQARQELRFEKILEINNFIHNKKIVSVLEVGCGFGDMGHFLAEYAPNVCYTGVDINPELIQIGKEKFPSLDLRVMDIQEETIETYDLVCSVGIFNHQLSMQDEMEYIEEMLAQFFKLAKLGVAVDFMSTFVDFQHSGAFHMPEGQALRIAKKMTKRIILRNDYLDYEYCMYLLK